MSADSDVRSDCASKTGYLSWDRANKVMRRTGFKDRHGRGPMTVYRCRLCPKWHIGRSS